MAMRTLRLLLAAVIAGVATVTVAYAAGAFTHVGASRFDPGHTFLVQAMWINGIGCPTNAVTFDGTNFTPYTDAACPTGDRRDRTNQGLLLAKTGPTANDAAGQAQLTLLPSHVTELGYDIRKPGSSTDPRGSHCGAGAPRFDIVTSNNSIFFLACNSPAADSQFTSATGWTRLRWGAGALAVPQFGGPGVPLGTLVVKQIFIIFDEGQDTGTDNFGLAVLDNIDVNGTLVGQRL
jgi:hypothetical protein